MIEQEIDRQSTRMIFMGDPALTDGFKLIGFETWSNPSTEELNWVLEDLVQSQQKAFVIVDRQLVERNSPMLRRLRLEGGRVVITQIPPLNDPDCFNCEIDDQVKGLLGASILEGHD